MATLHLRGTDCLDHLLSGQAVAAPLRVVAGRAVLARATVAGVPV